MSLVLYTSCKLAVGSRIPTRFRTQFLSLNRPYVYDTLSGPSQMILPSWGSNCLSCPSSKINKKEQKKLPILSFSELKEPPGSSLLSIPLRSPIGLETPQTPRTVLSEFKTTEVPGIVPFIEQTCIRYYLDWILVFFLPFWGKWLNIQKLVVQVTSLFLPQKCHKLVENNISGKRHYCYPHFTYISWWIFDLFHSLLILGD